MEAFRRIWFLGISNDEQMPGKPAGGAASDATSICGLSYSFGSKGSVVIRTLGGR